MRIEIQALTELERLNRGIDGTDVAIVVAVDGVQIGVVTDYGTFEPFNRVDEMPGLANGATKIAAEKAVEAASDLWFEATGNGGGSAG